MNLTLILFSGFVAALLLLLVWALRAPKRPARIEAGACSLEETGQRHTNYLAQIRQALAPADYDFLSKRATRGVQRRVRRERRKVARAYLDALRVDFRNLLRLARVIAVLSPEVVAVQEFERLRLTAVFAWRYQIIRWKLWAGIASMTQLDSLSNLVSGLSVRMDAAMKELGERAAIAAELASLRDGRGLDVA